MLLRADNDVHPASAGNQEKTMQTATLERDVDVLEQLNQGYIDAVQHSDVRWFEQNLAEDFLNSNPDFTLVDREAFIAQNTRLATFSNFRAEDVRIRILGEVAIIHGQTRYTKAGGQEAAGRYTDVWARRKGRWLCVAAHVARG
jgi:ketosteroid isomerase-like protein